MGFNVSEVKHKKFDNINELEEYVKTEKEKTVYEPISDYIKQESMFIDDEFFGRGKRWVSFNEHGFRDFCETLNLPKRFIEQLNEKNLTSNVLNDCLKNEKALEKLANHRFVINKENQIVMGVVSNTYLDYSNHDFITNLKETFGDIYKKYKLVEGYNVNSQLYVRLSSNEISAGTIDGIGGIGEDKHKIGLQLSNSMVGNASVRVELFVYRLICANGLLVQSTKKTGRIIHSGNRETFITRIENQLSPINEEVRSLPDLLEILMSIPFNPERIVELEGENYIYNIISLNASELKKRNKLKINERKQYDIDMIRSYPKIYALEHSKKVFESHWRNNHSMYDFINIFTEYANSFKHDITKKIEIERNTGEFVNWIRKNKFGLI